MSRGDNFRLVGCGYNLDAGMGRDLPVRAGMPPLIGQGDKGRFNGLVQAHRPLEQLSVMP